MAIAVIDYGSGNLRSVAKALERVAENKKIKITSAANDLNDASHIILPGVGAFADCMNGLKTLPGMLEALEKNVRAQEKNFLGICVGMQMLFEKGHEHGMHNGLGWLAGEVVALAQKESLKIPHMGWNDLCIQQEHPLMRGIKNGEHAYFVHSYHARCGNNSDIAATTRYGQEVVAVVARNNIMGTQFHPEKSQGLGLKLLENFVKL